MTAGLRRARAFPRLESLRLGENKSRDGKSDHKEPCSDHERTF
jgi:hypothetical protein